MAGKGGSPNPGPKLVENVHIGLEDETRKDSIERLNQILSDEFALYLKARKYHWNASGPMFNDLHSFFENLYKELDTIVDEVAERIKQLGGNAEGTMAEYEGRTRIREDPGVYPSDRDMISSTMEALESLIMGMRDILASEKEHSDEGTAHFLVDIMLKHEKKAWMLRAMLQGWGK